MRGRPGCPTGQKKTSVGATAGSPLFLRLQGKVGYRIAPSSAPVCALGHLPPKGKALGVGASLSDYNTHPLPARPAGGRAVTGVGQMGRRPGKKRRRTPAGSPQTRKGGSREEEPLPPWCSFLRLSSKKVGLPRRSRRAPGALRPEASKQPQPPVGDALPKIWPPGPTSGSAGRRSNPAEKKKPPLWSATRGRIPRRRATLSSCFLYVCPGKAGRLALCGGRGLTPAPA